MLVQAAAPPNRYLCLRIPYLILFPFWPSTSVWLISWPLNATPPIPLPGKLFWLHSCWTAAAVMVMVVVHQWLSRRDTAVPATQY